MARAESTISPFNAGRRAARAAINNHSRASSIRGDRSKAEAAWPEAPASTAGRASSRKAAGGMDSRAVKAAIREFTVAHQAATPPKARRADHAALRRVSPATAVRRVDLRGTARHRTWAVPKAGTAKAPKADPAALKATVRKAG